MALQAARRLPRPARASWSPSAPSAWQRPGQHAARRACDYYLIARRRPRARPPGAALGGHRARASAAGRCKYGSNTPGAGRGRARHPGAASTTSSPPHQALGPHQEPALQPLGPDEEGRCSGLKEDVNDRVLPAHGATWRRGQDRMKDVPGALAAAQGRVRGPGAEPGQGAGYDVRGPWPILVVERGDKREQLTNDSEQDITNALIKVTRDSKKTVCFARGRGRARHRRHAASAGYSGVEGRARRRATTRRRRSACCARGTVPADCTVLVVARPREGPRCPQIVDAIKRLRARAAARRCVHGRARAQGARRRTWSRCSRSGTSRPGSDVVVDVSRHGPALRHRRAHAARDPSTRTTRSRKDFRLPTAFHTRPQRARPGTGSVDGVSRQNLVETSRAVLGGDGPHAQGPDQVRRGQGPKGPVSLGAVATVRGRPPRRRPRRPARRRPRAARRRPPPEEPPKAPEGRVVAFGDADFASNTLLGFQGNQDLFLNTVAWLAEDADLISIRPKEPDDQRLFLTAAAAAERGLRPRSC